MIRFLTRLAAALPAIGFQFLHALKFRRLGWGVRMWRPFKIDGADRIELGRHTVFQRGGWLYCRAVDANPASLKIGKGCVFGFNNHIAAVRDMVIGDHVLTANNVYISDNLHGYEDVTRPIMYQPVQFKGAVSIGDGSWIGENACIIGARIGRNCVIGANAVVTRDVPDYCVAAGIPATIIRQFDPSLQEWHSRGPAKVTIPE